MAGRHLTVLVALLTGVSPVGIALAEPIILADERLAPGIYPAPPVPVDFAVPSEPGHPRFDLDWSVGLKGTYTSATTGNSFSSTLNPQFTAVHDGLRADIVIDGSAELVKPWNPGGDVDLSALRLGITAVAPIDSTTNVTANAAIAINQDVRTVPGLDPLIVVPPEVVTGSLGLRVDRSFGRFNLAVRGDAFRTQYGPTNRRDTGVTNNSEQDLWALDSSLRLGFQATPIFEVFGQASLGRDQFDRPSAAGLRSDATDYAMRGGIAGQWRGTLAASASVGLGYHDFDQAGIGDVTTQLYDASVTFTPNSTLSLTARLNTSIDPVGADASGTARVTHRAEADISHTVNSWLRLRAAFDWSQSELIGSAETEQSHGAGIGADYRFNSRAALSADYGFAQRNNSLNGTLDSHTLSLGVTLQR